MPRPIKVIFGIVIGYIFQKGNIGKLVNFYDCAAFQKLRNYRPTQYHKLQINTFTETLICLFSVKSIVVLLVFGLVDLIDARKTSEWG